MAGTRFGPAEPNASIRTRSGLAMSRSVVVFPQPDGAEQREELAAGDRQIDRVDRDLREALGQRHQLNLATGHLGFLSFYRA
jgi:hypothetical protein